VLPFVSDLNFKKEDVLYVVINRERYDEGEAWLAQMGWHPDVFAEEELDAPPRLDPA
jgi:hypothetical protein